MYSNSCYILYLFLCFNRNYNLENDDQWTDFLNRVQNVQKKSCKTCLKYQKDLHGLKIRYQEHDAPEVSFIFLVITIKFYYFFFFFNFRRRVSKDNQDKFLKKN